MCIFKRKRYENSRYDIQAAGYKQTYDRVIRLITEVRDQDFYFCIGNHDASYLWMKFESGYSVKAEHLVREKMLELRNAFADPEKFAYVHRIDNVIFSHAGICALFAMKHAKTAETVDQLIYIINHELTEHELWTDESPLWIRMQYSNVWTLKGNLLVLKKNAVIVSEKILSKLIW